MRVFFILGSSYYSIATTPHHQHSRHSKHSKPSASWLTPSTEPPTRHSSSSLSSISIAVHPRFPLHSTVPLDIHPSDKNYLGYYADLASKLAEQGKIDDFALLLESVVGAGTEASQFASELNAELVAKGISRVLRERGIWSVVQVVRKFDELGIDPLKFLDGSAMESMRRECRLLAKSGDVEQLVELMEVFAGFHFSVKQLMKPSDVIRMCVDQRNPTMSIRYARILPDAHYLYCTIINEFGKKRDLGSALVAYEETNAYLSGPNMYILRTIIDVCGLCGDYMKSRYIYKDVLLQKITPNVYVFNSLMNVNANDLSYIFDVYKDMQNLDVTADLASYNILLKACCLAERVDLAKDIYKEIQHLESIGILKLDVFTYSTIVKVFADAKLWQMALKVKEDMQSAGVTPNVVTWSSLISACANSGLIDLAIELFEEMILTGYEPNTRCCNILLHACVEASQYDRAFRFFRSWKERETQVDVGQVYDYCRSNTVTNLNSENQLCSSNKTNSPSNVPQLTFAKGFVFKPTATTYNILMKACGTDYYRVKALMNEMKTVGLAPNHISWSILLDITGASGNAEGAIQILKTMRAAGIEPDVVAFTTAIKVCMESKLWKLAFSLYEEMKRFEIQPNKVTYSTLLGPRGSYGSLYEVQQCLAIYQDMRKAGYNADDHYLKELIEEWCEGVIQDSDHRQGEYSLSSRTALGNPPSLLLEKVAEHLQKRFSESTTIDLRGLTKVEARIVLLAVLRMIKESYVLGQDVKDDIFIIFGASKDDDEGVAPQKFGVKLTITKLLLDELQLDVVQVDPRIALYPSSSHNIHRTPEGQLQQTVKYSTRRPYAVQRLKITRKSLLHWLQKNKVPLKISKVIFS